MKNAKRGDVVKGNGIMGVICEFHEYSGDAMVTTGYGTPYKIPVAKLTLVPEQDAKAFVKAWYDNNPEAKSYFAQTLRSVNSEAQKSASRANGAKGGRPLHTITMPCKVGIYDNSEYTARVYRDKIIVTSPYVKWVGNTGGYAERKEAIRDQAVVDAVIRDIADDAETSAWRKIGIALNDEWLSY